jgi:hypothetical protein
MAGPTRLELATSGVTGRRSNQLNYDPVRLRTLRVLWRDKRHPARCSRASVTLVACLDEARSQAASEVWAVQDSNL